MSEEKVLNDSLSQDLNDAVDEFNGSLDYLEAWHDETLNGTLDAEKSTLEYRRQVLLQMIKLNHTFDMIRAGLYAMAGIAVADKAEEPPA